MPLWVEPVIWIIGISVIGSLTVPLMIWILVKLKMFP